ncbi:MAG: TIGR04282 family arsenosugar biosynthesis glycosyltransferase [Acidobacteria bacterium]|nr:TIGR04282 family arsenosugar biosynthesis glycosyltransferase [Acidobacteriota bacterium]
MKTSQRSATGSLNPGAGLSTEVPVCIFVKPFVAGQVKTRLIPLLGAEGAAEIAGAMFQDTRAIVRRVPWAHEIVASPAPLPETLADKNGSVWLQGDGNLGIRLERILRRALSCSDMAIAIGSDSPGLPLQRFEEAHNLLQMNDAVLGPCEDGGFYLVGLRRCPPSLFDGIGWSQQDTLSQTIARLQESGLKISLLEPWFDVDRPDDLDRLRSLIASGQLAAPHTAEALNRLKTPMDREVRAT